MFGSKNTKPKTTLFVLLVIRHGIRNNHVITIILILKFPQCDDLSQLAILLHIFLLRSVTNDIIRIGSFPNTNFLVLLSNDHEIGLYIRHATQFLILLHQIDINLCVFKDFHSELHIIEPAFVTVQLHVFRFRFIFGILRFRRTHVSGCFALPLTLNRVLRPVFRENFSHIEAIEVLYPVMEGDPPGTVDFLLFVSSLLQFITNITVLVPFFGIIRERATPAAIRTPGVPDLY